MYRLFKHFYLKHDICLITHNYLKVITENKAILTLFFKLEASFAILPLNKL